LVNAAVTGAEVDAINMYADPTVLGDVKATTLQPIAINRQRVVQEFQVPAVRLSQYIKIKKHVDLLKLDIEGAELEVLEEISPHLDCVDQLYIESHYDPTRGESSFSRLVGLLERHGFRCLVRSYLPSPMSKFQDKYHTLLVHAYLPKAEAGLRNAYPAA
jgi:hypothetical protein